MSSAKIPTVNSTIDETIDYFTEEPWGKHYESDKYWDDEVLFNNFIVFYCYAYAWLNLPRPTRNQLEIAKHISSDKHKSRMVAAMRGLAKSLSAQIYTVWRLFRDLNEHILVMSASGTRAANFTGFVKKLVRLLPATSHMTPRHNMERTSGSSFDVAGADDSDSPSVYAVGVENQIAGFRASLVIYDDIETKQNSTTVIMREKINHYAKEAHNLLMTGKDETITLCTPHSRDSIYMEWMNEGHKALIIPSEYPQKDHLLYDHIADHIKKKAKNFPSLIGSAVDERIDDEFLSNKISKIGRSEYKLQYLIDVTESDAMKHPLKLSELVVMDVSEDEAPMTMEPSSMPENMLYIKHNGFKTDRLYKPSSVGSNTVKYQTKIMSIDPSGRGKDETAYSIIYVLAGRIFVKEIGGISGGGYDKDTLDGLASLAKKHNVDYCVVESNFGDGAFYRMFQPVLHSKAPFCGVEEVRVHTKKEERIIDTLEPLLNQRAIVMDKALLDRDFSAQSAIYSFTYQMSHMTREKNCIPHDDRIDAFHLAATFAVDNFFDYNQEILENHEEEDYFEGFEKAFGFKINQRANNRLNYSNAY